MKANSASPHMPNASRRSASIPTTAAYPASTTRMPPSSTVLSALPNAEMAKFLTGGGVRSMAAWPTASTGEPCGAVRPAASCAAPMATAAESTPTTAPATACGARGWSSARAGADLMAELISWRNGAGRRPSTLPVRRRFVSPAKIALLLPLLLEGPACGRSGEVAGPHAEDAARPYSDGGVLGRVEEVHPVVRPVLGVHQVDYPAQHRQCRRYVRGALDDHRVGGVLGGDAAARVGGQVTDLSRAGAAGKPQRAVVPHAPDRHDVRLAVRPHRRDPVVARRRQPLR